ncbi:MAG: RnfABCDGE type electron transport complex subunit B [Gammaproteobacteria bacterium]
MPNYKVTIEQIDALLPQTQCGECGYAGCLPYAKAIVNQDEAINKCPPGGVNVLKQLAEVLEQNVESMLQQMKQNERTPMTAVIIEDQCIGCTKCIKACPVDAIIGSAKSMHTILTQECTGCGLCLPACPVDCIELLPIEKPLYIHEKARSRYQAKLKREQNTKNLEKNNPILTEQAKKAEILAAVARTKTKRGQNDSGHH